MSVGNTSLPRELIVYGNVPLMNMNYCLNGKSNKCYPTCTAKCNTANKYYLKDRMNMKFRVLFDNIQTVSTIYNSKITSISINDIFNKIDNDNDNNNDNNDNINVNINDNIGYNSDDYSKFINCTRIDILDESVEEINHIVALVKENKRLEGKDYTNGNLNKDI